MRSSLFRHTAVLSLGLFVAAAALGQDLGSSNKLFGGKPAKQKPSASKKISRKALPAARRAASAAKKKVSSKNAPSKSVTAKVKKIPTKAVTSASKQTVTGKAVIAPRIPTKKEADETPVVTAGKTVAGRAGDDSRFEQLIQTGNDARDERNYLAAEAAYNEAKNLKRKDARSLLGLGSLYTDQQRWEDAEKAYRASIALSPNDVASLVALSFVLARPVTAPNLSERYAEAESLARKAIKLDPRNPLASDQLGVALEHQGEIGSETESAYRRAIQLDAAFAPAYAHLGRLLKKKGRLSESAAAYRSAMTRLNDVATRVLVAEVMLDEGRPNEAIQMLDVAIAADTKNPTALTLLGRALTLVGNFADAERTLKRGLDVSPSSFVAYSLLGTLYTRQGKLESAENVLLKSIRFVTPFEKRRLATQFEALGDGFAKSGKARNALRAYQQASSLDPDRETLSGKLAKVK